MNAKREEQKQKVMEEKKRMFFMREFFFGEDFFGKYKRDKTHNKVYLFAKNAWIEWKRMDKQEKKGRSFLENLAKDNGEVVSEFVG